MRIYTMYMDVYNKCSFLAKWVFSVAEKLAKWAPLLSPISEHYINKKQLFSTNMQTELLVWLKFGFYSEDRSCGKIKNLLSSTGIDR